MRIRILRSLALVLAIGLVAPLLAQPGRQGFGGGMDASMLLGQKSVQEELKMTEDQIAKVTKVGEELRTKYADDLKAAFKDKDKMTELRKKMSEERTKMMDGVLKAEQTKRLSQIEVQVGGLNALTKDEVSKTLKLTEEQITKAKGMVDDLRKDSGELMKDVGRDKDKRAEATEKIAKMTKEATAKFLGTLSADQTKAYKELTGEEFKGKIERTGGRPKTDK